jgi:hypothetical protein
MNRFTPFSRQTPFSYRQRRHRPAEPLPDLQRRLQRIQVLGIENRRQRRPIHRPVVLHRLGRNVRRVRDLLHANHTVITHRNRLLLAIVPEMQKADY